MCKHYAIVKIRKQKSANFCTYTRPDLVFERQSFLLNSLSRWITSQLPSSMGHAKPKQLLPKIPDK